MTIDGRYYTEPEAQAYIKERKHRLYEARDRIEYCEDRIKELEKDNLNLESRCADLQIAYNNEMADLKMAKRLLKSAVNVLKTFIPCDEDYCRECQNKALNNNACDYDDHFIWMYLNEALELIGEETNEN